MDNDDASTVPDADGDGAREGPAPSSWCAAEDAALAAAVARWCSDAAAVAAYRSVHFRRTQDWLAIEALVPPSASGRRSACAAKNRFWWLLREGWAPPPNYLTVNSWRDSSGGSGGGSGGSTSTPPLAGASKRARASAASLGSCAGAAAAGAGATSAAAAACAAAVASPAAGSKRARGEAGGAEALAGEGGGGAPCAAWGAEEARKLRELVQRFPPAGNPHPKSCSEGSATALANAAYWERVAVLLGTERTASGVYKHYLATR